MWCGASSLSAPDRLSSETCGVARFNVPAPHCGTLCQGDPFWWLYMVEEATCMVHRNFRLPDLLAKRIVQVAEKQRYASTSAFIRAAIEEKLNSRDENGSEERIVATLERLGRELRRLGTALQAEF